MKKISGGRGGGALMPGKALYCGEWRDCFCFQSSGQLAFVKMYNFLQLVVLLKNAVLLVSFVQMGSFGIKSWFSREIKSQ